MKVIFTNAVELEAFLVSGSKVNVNGVARDSLTFSLSADYSLDEVDAMFTEAACESITLEDTDSSYIHKGYTIRYALKKEAVEVEPATLEADAVMEDRIFITMAQRTYTENQLASLTETVDYLVLESLMA